MQNADLIQTLLQKRLTDFKRKNPQFSNRAYAKKLGISSGALTEILSGTRNVSRKLALRFCDKLLLDPMERSHVMKAFPEKRVKLTDQVTHYLKLSADQFKLMSEWHYFAILTLMKTRSFKSDLHWVSDRLKISKALTSRAIEGMIRLGVLTVQPDGTWTRSDRGHRTSDDLTDLSIQKNHLQTLEQTKAALETYSVAERDFSSLNLPLDLKDLPEAKQMIRKFQTEFYERFNLNQQPDEVFRLSIQLIPLTQLPNQTQKENKS